MQVNFLTIKMTTAAAQTERPQLLPYIEMLKIIKEHLTDEELKDIALDFEPDVEFLS